MTPLSLSITDIANDTFAFGAWILGKIEGPTLHSVYYKDLETLNKETVAGRGSDICKISFNTLSQINFEYTVLKSGSALVRGAGPKIVSKTGTIDYEHSLLAIPGKQTTAFLLTQSLLPPFKKVIELPYGKILDALEKNEADCGLLIHESSFELEKRGFFETISLYDLWHKKTKNLPLPLGGIVAKKSLGTNMIKDISEALQKSIAYAKASPEEIEPFVLKHSPVKDLSIIRKSINFWVNEETKSLSSIGEKAIETLVNMNQKEKILVF